MQYTVYDFAPVYTRETTAAKDIYEENATTARTKMESCYDFVETLSRGKNLHDTCSNQ